MNKTFFSKVHFSIVFIYFLLISVILVKCLIIDTNNGNNEKNKLTQVFRNKKYFDDESNIELTLDTEKLTTKDPCLIHYCSKGRECILNETTNQPYCICQRYCSKRHHPVCGSNAIIYPNHCELHRASCLLEREILYQQLGKCKDISEKKGTKKHKIIDKNNFIEIHGDQNSNYHKKIIIHKENDTEITKPYIFMTSKQNLSNLSSKSSKILINDKNKEFCTSQEYEIMKDNLLLYSHTRLMSQDNNHSKDFLVSIMFSHYDQNNNGHLESAELSQISIDEHLDELSNGCVLNDMLKFDDIDNDARLSINEFYQAFTRLYSVSVVSLDKALEINHLSARVGDNVEIKCDVTGSPPPPIVWKRNSIDLSIIDENEIRVFNDGSLYLTRIQLEHSGNYTCHAQRNQDIVQTHILNVYTIPELQVMPKLQSKRPGEYAKMFCHIIGDPFPKVEWLKNDDYIDISNTEKYEIIGNGTSLGVKSLKFSDTGAYMCQATNIGGSVRDISSLIVQDEPTPTVINEDQKFFVFHEYGIAIYEPSACHLHHQIQGTDIIPGTQEYVCGNKDAPCSWGRAINIGTRYIYVSQPNQDRILVISIIQMVVIDVITTDQYPVDLYYVPHLDQVWILNMRYTNNSDLKTIQVIRDARQKRKHYTIHPEPIDGKFDLIKNLFLPSADLEQLHFIYKYAYVTHKNQRGLYKLDLANLRYTKSVDLTLYNCVPENIEFSALYGLVIISCDEPVTNRPQGQLVLDYLTDTVLFTKISLNGMPRISPDSRHLATIEHSINGVIIVIQKITANGLEFLFDVNTSLNISDITFFESQTIHGYDLFATANDKEDILYLNLYTGEVEMITGVGSAIPPHLMKWGHPARPIKASGLFGQYLVTPSDKAIFVINGRTRTVNCEIGSILNPTVVLWTRTLTYANHNLINTSSSTII